MKNSNSSGCCPKCGRPIPAEASEGICPVCALANIATQTEAGQPPGEQAAPALKAVAAAFPQLEILELIGTGGMGAVYKARQPKLDRLVALKLLSQPLAADQTFAERFHREARVLARLNHPGIVSVYDYGEAGGFFYLLMEYVEGVNLRQAMQAGRFTPAQALALVPRICEALQFAHEEGVLHRDIKPANILLDTRGRVKIADFGIAKLMGEKSEGATLTASGLAVGTPHYMAPEQLEHPQDVDQRADIYSLGVVFYEMLTGELPLGRFAPPSQKAAVDPRVDEVVLRALERERERRQHNAAEVKTQVEQITATPGQPPSAASSRTDRAGAAIVPPRSSKSYLSTPGHLATLRGCISRIFQGSGTLSLDSANLTFSREGTDITIPLRAITALAVGDYPPATKAMRLQYLSVTFEQRGTLRTLLFTPVNSGAASSREANPLVVEWSSALRQAVETATGRSLPVGSSDAVGWPWAQLAKVFALGTLLGTAGLSLATLWYQHRPPTTLHELIQAPLTCAGVLGGLIIARFWRRLRAEAEGNLDALVSRRGPPVPAEPPLGSPPTRFDRAWLALPRAFRRATETVLAILTLFLLLAFGTFSSEVNPAIHPPRHEWRIGAGQPWLKGWPSDPTSFRQSAIVLNLATTSFACGVAGLLLGVLTLRLYRSEITSRAPGPGSSAGQPPAPSGPGTGLGPSGTLVLPTCPPPQTQVNAEAGRWFERVRAATMALTRTAPASSDPARVTFSAEPSWNRKGLPLFAPFLVVWGWGLWHAPQFGRPGLNPVTFLIWLCMFLLAGAAGWFAWGFLWANSALRRGQLDAVTCDESSSASAQSAHSATPSPVGPRRFSWMGGV